MAWARLDDLFPWHRKVRRLTDAAYRLHTTAICFSARDLTDGRITTDDLDEMPGIRQPQRRVDELVRAGLWEVVEDGWVIHDYLDFNWSRDRVEASRQATRERKRRWDETRRQKREGRDGNAVTHASVTPLLTPSVTPLLTPSVTLPHTHTHTHTHEVLTSLGTSPPSEVLHVDPGQDSSSSSLSDARESDA